MWVRIRSICWWWTRTPARARCPRTRTRWSCGWRSCSTSDGAVSPGGRRAARRRVAEALQAAEDKGVEDVLPFATSRRPRGHQRGRGPGAGRRPRPASTCRSSAARTRRGSTFLAARRWFGWSAGQAAGPRHRRRLAGDRVRHRRGPGRGGLAAAGRGPPHRGLAAGRPAGRRRTSGRCAGTCGPRSPAWSASSAASAPPDHVVAHVEDLQAAGPHRGRGALGGGPVRAAGR